MFVENFRYTSWRRRGGDPVNVRTSLFLSLHLVTRIEDIFPMVLAQSQEPCWDPHLINNIMCSSVVDGGRRMYSQTCSVAISLTMFIREPVREPAFHDFWATTYLSGENQFLSKIIFAAWVLLSSEQRKTSLTCQCTRNRTLLSCSNKMFLSHERLWIVCQNL